MQATARAPITFRYHDGAPGFQGNAIHVANPSDKEWQPHRYLFRFGAVGSRFVLVYMDNLSDALEVAAGYCADREWWGFITPHAEVKDSGDLGCDCADPFDCESHTYTESGWLDSGEWFVEEDPTNERLRAIHVG